MRGPIRTPCDASSFESIAHGTRGETASSSADRAQAQAFLDVEPDDFT
jgi:hypothetical protein